MTGTVGSRCPGTKGVSEEIKTVVVEFMQKSVPSVVRERGAPVEVPFRHTSGVRGGVWERERESY